MKTQEEMRAEVIGKAAEDEEFRTQLIDDPKSTIEKALGITIPDSVSVKVHEESGTEAHLVLPPSSRLSDSDMRAVSAGAAFWG